MPSWRRSAKFVSAPWRAFVPRYALCSFAVALHSATLDLGLDQVPSLGLLTARLQTRDDPFHPAFLTDHDQWCVRAHVSRHQA